VSQELGIESPAVPRIATPFGGGIAGMGSVCGAVVGAVMAIGLARGREEPDQPRGQAYAPAQQLYRRFQQEMGSAVCRELTGIDLSTPEGPKQLYSSDVPQRVCLPAVAAAYRLALALLREPEEGSAPAG
jgi:C_GCAxxG_C_C family probable redox protein